MSHAKHQRDCGFSDYQSSLLISKRISSPLKAEDRNQQKLSFRLVWRSRRDAISSKSIDWIAGLTCRSPSSRPNSSFRTWHGLFVLSVPECNWHRRVYRERCIRRRRSANLGCGRIGSSFGTMAIHVSQSERDICDLIDLSACLCAGTSR